MFPLEGEEEGNGGGGVILQNGDDANRQFMICPSNENISLSLSLLFFSISIKRTLLNQQATASPLRNPFDYDIP